MSHRVDPTGLVLVVAAAVGFGMLGPLARFAGDLGFSASSFAAWRSFTSVAALAALLALGVVIGRLRTIPLAAIARFEWLQLVAMGLFVAGTTLGMFLAFERTTIAVALIVFYTFPLMVAVAAVPIYGEHLGPRKASAIALALLGLVLLLAGPGATGSDRGLDVVGMLLALVAAVCQVGYALVGSRGFANVPSFQSATILRSFSALFYLVVLVPILVLLGEGGSLTEPIGSAEAWVLILVAGILAAALPTAFLLAGYRRVGPTRGAVLMLVEPLTGVLLAALILDERPGPIQLVGGLLVLVGAALVQLSPVRRVEAAPPPAAE